MNIVAGAGDFDCRGVPGSRPLDGGAAPAAPQTRTDRVSAGLRQKAARTGQVCRDHKIVRGQQVQQGRTVGRPLGKPRQNQYRSTVAHDLMKDLRCAMGKVGHFPVLSCSAGAVLIESQARNITIRRIFQQNGESAGFCCQVPANPALSG